MSRRVVGAVRLFLLTLAAIGFLAMHGLAAPDPFAGHCSPMTLSAAVDHSGPDGTEMSHTSARGTVSATPTPPDSGDTHDGMAACVFVLLGITALALHALRGGFGARPGISFASVREGRSPPRAPPRPVFLSLCVFRL